MKKALLRSLVFCTVLVFMFAGCVETGSTVLTGEITIDETSPRIGDMLTATYSNGNGTGTATWQWFADDDAIQNSDSATYVVKSEDLDKTLKARVSYSEQSGFVESAPTDLVRISLLTGEVTIDNIEPRIGDTLTASHSYENGGTATWEWLADNEPIANSDNGTYTVKGEDFGKTLRARVSYSDREGYAISEATEAVRYIEITGEVEIDNMSPRVSDTLTASHLSDDEAGTAATWQWFADDEEIENSNSDRYTVKAEDFGKTLTAQISYSNRDGSVRSEATAAVQLKLITGLVTIDNTNPRVGDTLRATHSTDNANGNATWQWYADDEEIANSENETYTVNDADLGKALKARVSYANQEGYTESEATAAVKLALITGTVTIDNMSPRLEDVLTASYTGNGTGTATWLWYADDTEIENSNNDTYTVKAEDLGKTLKARVSFPDKEGFIESEATAAVRLVLLTGTVNINNMSPKAGDILTADYTGNGSGTQTWQWFRGSTPVGTDSDTYTVVADDVGSAIKARVSFSDRDYYIETATEAVEGKLIILQANTHGNADGGFARSTIELYNNSNAPVNLGAGNYSLHIGENATPGWTSFIRLTGIIPAKSSYLIISNSNTVIGTPRAQLPPADQMANFVLTNNGFKVALMRNHDSLLTVANPFTAENLRDHYVDMLGVTNNATGFEGAFAQQSRPQITRRATLTDTDNNGADFVRTDIRRNVFADANLFTVWPRNSSMGEWDPVSGLPAINPQIEPDGDLFFSTVVIDGTPSPQQTIPPTIDALTTTKIDLSLPAGTNARWFLNGVQVATGADYSLLVASCRLGDNVLRVEAGNFGKNFPFRVTLGN